MRLIGNLLVWICLAIGLLAATSIYTWPVGADASADVRFELGVGADGKRRRAQLLRDVKSPEGAVVARSDAALDPSTLADIRQAGVARVMVKHPAGAGGALLSRWSGKWVFLSAVGGLLVGAFLIRRAARRAAVQSAGEHTVQRPEDLVVRLRDELSALRARLPGLSDDAARLRAIIEQLGEVQAALVPAFVETRPVLIAQRGLGGYARVMDLFAAAERKVNRAWSAAADGVLHESQSAIDEAATACEQLVRCVAPA
ncbi:MAG: hypothetical protein DYG94_04425 [Leptolyngbya sp. PLA3]|nr:MAG: hypothetical protein EDM82_07470 [Cyanobacteria bacterium CYA]MCE7967977.1 hypothetical protein [Leptolyngbya sp. PL-A3]